MRAWIAPFVCLWLAGCAHGPYGNFADRTTPAINQQLASATARQLAVVHPPASTRLRVNQQTSDSYGTSLVTALRASGFSVQEFNPDAQPAPAPAGTAVPLAVNYVLDMPQDSELLRVTLLVGRESLSRVYAVQSGRVSPAGAWVRKE
ncbi:conjugal transfer protein TrbH [Pseudomonas sp. 39004]|uniref:conjugal transfer protein TrbH n=1 Tax=Pseudomonas sp. 39004 TaxID=2967213 RepID=UPI0023646A5A|nr:conjugal transfer protein TrbH [Pseudomonas sp. 39004]MDD1962153.1 conjugal transfer protein TrbH [Pseudomonas sp. 39004]